MSKLVFCICLCLVLGYQSQAQSYTKRVVPVFGSITGTDLMMERSVLLQQDSIKLSNPAYRIVAYGFSWDTDSGLTTYTVKGAKITEQVKLVIKNSATQLVYFSDFTVTSKNGHSIPALPPVTITLID